MIQRQLLPPPQLLKHIKFSPRFSSFYALSGQVVIVIKKSLKKLIVQK
ncbi:MAG: hypothetical protein H6Q61_745 [Firmicutes bacterium]|nr:hypothetical protein [Bacillota bacterium]